MNYKIYPVYLGDVQLQHPWVFHRKLGETVKMHYGLFVLKDEEEKLILVDSGRPCAEEILSGGYPFAAAANAPDFRKEIEKYGVVPEKVETIILTHLHYDHAWNLDMFPNARIYVQEREIRHAVYPLKHERQPYGIMHSTVKNTWIRHVSRICPLYGDTQILPGISVLLTPGHTYGGQSVKVDTKEGPYLLVGDWVNSIENVKRQCPNGLVLDTSMWHESYRKIMGCDAIIFPTHDDSILQRQVYG